MNPKNVVSATLLAFVAASVLYLLSGKAGPLPVDPVAGAGAGESGVREGTQVVAYYFHGTVRCPTCLAIENTARNLLESEFAEAFETDAMEWRAVDFEQPENEHLAKEFQLTGASLLLVKEAAGRPDRWENLDRVWELIGDEAAFRAYVLDRARGYLNDT